MPCKSIRKLHVKREEKVGRDKREEKMLLRPKSRDDASPLHMQKYARVTPNLMLYNGEILFFNSSFYRKVSIYAKTKPAKNN
jgi:hypothetical protein